jgi:hypothetical protein
MRISRLFLPLLFAFALLTAQQGGAAHALSHILEHLAEQKQDQQAPQHHACEKCATFAQLGSAPVMGAYNFLLTVVSGETFRHSSITFRFIPALVAVARGPPADTIR